MRGDRRWIYKLRQLRLSRMSYNLTVVNKEEYLQAIVTGDRTAEAVLRFANDVIAACEEHGASKVMADVSGLTGKLKAFESFRIVADHFPKLWKRKWLLKTAVVDSPSNRGRFGFTEMVARNRGFRLRAFDNVAAAEAWLLESGPVDDEPSTSD